MEGKGKEYVGESRMRKVRKYLERENGMKGSE